jgi:phage regulator Rha-like protein
MNKESIVPAECIENHILIIRGQRVMLDQDLAILYETPTKRLNELLRRNLNRFPKDFAFQLTNEEWKCLRSQFATSNKGRGGRRHLPTAFTEHGALMLANILRSERAAQMSIEVIRAFIHLRRLSASHEAMAKEAKEIKSFILKHAQKSDQEFRRVWTAIEKLSAPQTEERRIGFRVD